ncbi:hypothetical protein A1O3_09881 [Capronia epimyces CBS 606.96]|uniref:Peptidase S8/S53 domain-containing protein n=1 Tax=Capronia epimyces CBS 606.96 TaxID=1182542 RepID=W9XAX9_9EURO|nr:uncharacterized protein A1O3_09881 [Capronia epimyces CBS 606.96]EXJ77652.1 hypothetical protein A1O3_09881 [Capronia epimyces CBS 606.96]
MSGTSVATPIAAGVAASVTHYLRELPKDTDKDLDFLLSKLRDKQSMVAVLLELTEKRKGFNYIAPWILFNGTRAAGVAQVLLDKLR